MLFGLSKDYFGIANPNQQYFFIIFAFIYGMGSTLADTGMLVAVEKMCTASNLARSQYNSARSDTNISVPLHVYSCSCCQSCVNPSNRVTGPLHQCGRVLAIGEIAVGVGCMVGPAIGGACSKILEIARLRFNVLRC